jgi:serpin B
MLGLAARAALAQAPLNPPASLAAADSAFAFDLFKQVTGDPSVNCFISPYSVSAVLQVIDTGAVGTTRTEMDRVLHLDGVGDLRGDCKRLDEVLAGAQKDVTLDLANAVWLRQGTQLKPGFAEQASADFRARIAALDFSNPNSANEINAWASSSTHGRIAEVVSPPIDPNTRVIVANAIYFKGRWARQFDQALTRPQPFTLLGGVQKPAPMMRQSGNFKYCEASGYQAVCLPYAGGRLQMCLFLPALGKSPSQMSAALAGDLSSLNSRFLDREGTVVLPRFKINYDVTLNAALRALGMQRAFTPAADFSGMSADKLYLSQVRQKSFVEVNEQGTEAAAVTTGTVRASVIRRPQAPFEMVLDRPFFFLIEDQVSQTILFMGLVADPTK